MKIQEIDNYAEKIRQNFRLPSLGLGIYYQGETYSHVYGDAEQDTLYPLASISKTFLATAICKLADEGKIDLDEPLKKYWPGFNMVDPYVTEHLTWRDALSHQSGLPAHDWMRFTNWNKQDLTLAQKAEAVGHLEPNHELRVKMQYSNLIFAVATYVMEQVINKDYGSYIRENLLKPLKLNNTFINHHECERSRIAKPYLLDHGNLREVPFIAPGKVGGASSMLASISDLLEWGKFQLKTAQTGTGITMQRYEPQSIMTVDRAYGGAHFSNYGLGMMMEDYHGYKYLFHSGSYVGYCSFLGFIPELDLAFVSTMNLDSTDAIFALAYQTIDTFAGLEQHDWIKTSSDFMAQRLATKQRKFNEAEGENPQPVKAKPELLGDYRNPGYGIVTISEQDDNLMAAIGPWSFPIIANSNGDKFVEIKIYDTLLPLDFTANGLEIMTEPALGKPTIFRK
ncbi:serine hydrolase [Lactobacillus sp. ESL0679]|uniref:serine hydrolase domain-containing protein n=1 Tax=Lactobacillus sp. ESL0679 TaxID=2983209 RepID=UPI0023F65731|nr:serine hydrolase domain-containing protein [Lactobacillus sp. ESL0679]MDF7683144.1 serine hydrolase [Lactobacillus sp. ESL0679]